MGIINKTLFKILVRKVQENRILKEEIRDIEKEQKEMENRFKEQLEIIKYRIKDTEYKIDWYDLIALKNIVIDKEINK